MTNRICRSCGQDFIPTSKWIPNKCIPCRRMQDAAFRTKNRDRINAGKRAHHIKHRDRLNKISYNYHLTQRYGITLERKEELLKEQGSVCAACSSDQPGSRRGWHVDHDHVTGSVRGILCHHCNLALGNVKDNPETLLRLVAYLHKDLSPQAPQ